MNVLKGALIALWLVGCGLLVINTGKKNAAFSEQSLNPVAPPPLARIKPAVVDVITLGHRGVIDDFMHLWMLQILTNRDLPKTYGPKLFESIMLVAEQKIHIESFYLVSCFFMANEMARPADCEPIMIKGLQSFPDSWRIPMVLGYVYNFQLNDPIRAAAMYGIASTRSESPPYVIAVAKKLINKEQVTQDEINKTMEIMSEVPGGRSRFAEILEYRDGRTPSEEPQP